MSEEFPTSQESAFAAPQEQYNSAPIDLARMGAYVRLNAESTQTAPNATWVNDLTNNTTNPSFSFAGVVSEVIVFNRKLSEEERQIVYGYLSRKYALEAKMPDAFKTSHNSAYFLKNTNSGIKLVSWGLNDYGQTNVPVNLGFVKDAAGGYLHTIAVDVYGNVHAWGAGEASPPTNVLPDFGQSIVPTNLGRAVRVGAGYFHSIAQLRDGTLRLWGNNANGQCSIPTDLVVADFAGGGFHTVVLLPNGTVKCFGAGQVSPTTNVQPEYGQGIVPSVVADVNNPNFVPVVQVAAGLYFTVALRSDGSLLAWGDNLYGQCTIPQNLGRVIKICAGRSHVLVLLEDGSVVSWGGITIDQENILLQTIPAGLQPAIDIAAGFRVNAGIGQDGTVYVWGSSSTSEGSNFIIPSGAIPSSRIWGTGRHLLTAVKVSQTNEYWGIQPHPNTNGLDTIPKGAEFSGITLNRFFAMNETVYKSAGTRLSDGTVLGSDTYA